MQEFTEKVRITIERYHMLQQGDSVLVGVSGGSDSVALVHALCCLRDRFGISLAVGHFNHRIRGEESNRDEQFVRHVAHDLDIPIVVEHGGENLDPETGNLEERARIERYRFLRHASRKIGAEKIAVGHTADDQAETVLLWLLRGAGKKGLGGIRPVRDDIVRPLIDTERADIVKFLKDRGIAWVEDASNRETAFTRNRIRRQLIPMLKEAFEPQVVKLLSTTAQVLRDEEAWLEGITGERFESMAQVVDDDTVGFKIETLAALPKALQRRLVRHALGRIQGSLRRFGFDHVEAVLSLMQSDSPHAEVALPDGLTARREYGMVRIERKSEAGEAFCYTFESLPEKVDITEIGRTILFKESEWNSSRLIQPSSETAIVDGEAVTFPLKIRSFERGDRFYPLGAGGSKKVKDLFIDLKLPLQKRMKIPLVVFNEVVAWVAGYRIDERVKVTERTRRVIKMVFG